MEELAKMSVFTQLDYVKTFLAYCKRIKNLSDTYMAILWPAAIGKPENHVLWDKEDQPVTYLQNRV